MIRRCSFDFHGECEQCVLDEGHTGLHRCVHESERLEVIDQPNLASIHAEPEPTA